MSRQRAKQQVGVALFPFLAVLICTMGALIVLLVLLVQQARIDATEIAQRQVNAEQESESERILRERLEDAQWRREMLEKNRAEKNAELADARARLAHLEDHARRLADKARELLQQAKSIDEGRTLRDDELERARAEAARLKRDIEQQKLALEGQAKQGSGSKDSYALIPYEGRSSTRRRPIYIECTEFGVIIQPEGLHLRPQDFQGPLGPGNPLDMALRATREYLESTLGSAAGQPYPLLVVRPGGVVAYERAKAAMKAWDDEFGYELISEELVLDFGAPDPALSARLDKTVADARSRQAAMIAMMPRRYQDAPVVSAAADEPAAAGSRTGSFVGSGRGSGVGGSGVGGSGVGGGGTNSGVGSGIGHGTGSGGGSSVLGGGGPAAGSGGGTAGTSPGGSYGSATPGGSGFGKGTSATTTGSGGVGSQTGTGFGGAGGQGQSFGGGASTGTSPGGTNGSAAAGGTASSGASSAGGGAMGQSGSASSTGGSSMGGSSMGGSSMGTPAPSLSFGDSRTPKKAAASGSGTASKSSKQASSGKGKNWALPNAKTNHIGVTRPIRVAILTDRIVLAREDGLRTTGNVVAVAPELTHDNVQQVVTAVQKEVEGWGLAVADGYWKPVLQAEVAPDAERHFHHLQSALSGSGIDIIRR